MSFDQFIQAFHRDFQSDLKWVSGWGKGVREGDGHLKSNVRVRIATLLELVENGYVGECPHFHTQDVLQLLQTVFKCMGNDDGCIIGMSFRAETGLNFQPVGVASHSDEKQRRALCMSQCKRISYLFRGPFSQAHEA